MPAAPYGHGTQIEIKNDDLTYFNKVVEKLDELRAQPLGARLLAEIRKKVIIVPTAAGRGNMCTSNGNTIFYRLCAAFRGADRERYSVQKELGIALMGAAGAGWTLERIGYTLAGGLSPATVQTCGNLLNPAMQASVGERFQAWRAGKDVRTARGERIATLIEDVADLKQPYSVLFPQAPRGTHRLGDHLLRFLRPWLTPGEGSGSRVNFNPDGMLGCMGDNVMKPRPPALGLAHELCHAWRNAVGERLFDDALSCGLDDDEVMTTGFPPYQYEKYSENLFRASWPGGALEMRKNYR